MTSSAIKQSRFTSLSDEIKPTNNNNDKERHNQKQQNNSNSNSNSNSNNSNKQKDTTTPNRSFFKETTTTTTTNSRFDFKEELADIKNTKKNLEAYHNKIQSELYDSPSGGNTTNRLTLRDRIQNERDQREKSELAEKERVKKAIEQSLLDVNSFPDLVQTTAFTPASSTPASSTPASSTLPMGINYASKVKWVPEEVEDKLKGLSLIDTANDNSNNQARQRQFVSAPPEVIMSKLNELYETWKADYIRLWGYDAYEYNYKFQNYDYEYFDKLDYIYDKEQFKLQEKEQERQRENDMEYYDEHDVQIYDE
jgi:hypothetical protein